MNPRRMWCAIVALLLFSALLFPHAAYALEIPKVITLKPTQYQDTVTLKGTVVDNGGKDVTENGFYIGADKSNLDKKYLADRPYDLSIDINTLAPSTTYYVQAYALNDLGEGLGGVISFQTNAGEQNIQPQSENEKLAADIRKLYGVQIVFDYRADWNTMARYTSAGEAENKRMLQLLKTALSKYPQGFFSRLRLRYIALGKNVTNIKGVALSGMSQGNTQQTMLLINVKASEQVIHHELFHCFEYASGYVLFDWKDANISGFKYDAGYDVTDASLLPPGFVTRYSLTMEEEDRAELFMYLMTESLRSSLLEQAAHDSVLKAKTQILLKAMKRYLGKLADKSRFVAVGDQVAAANKPRILGYAFVEDKASLYIGPGNKYAIRKEVKQGAVLPVVARSSQWLEVIDTDGKSYFVQDKEILFQTDAQRNDEKLALSKLAASLSHTTGVMVTFEGWNKPPSKISLTVSKDNRRIRSMLEELAAVLGDDAKNALGNVKNILLCSELSVSGSKSVAAVNGTSLYLNLDMINEGGAEAAIRQILQTDAKAA